MNDVLYSMLYMKHNEWNEEINKKLINYRKSSNNNNFIKVAISKLVLATREMALPSTKVENRIYRIYSL